MVGAASLRCWSGRRQPGGSGGAGTRRRPRAISEELLQEAGTWTEPGLSLRGMAETLLERRLRERRQRRGAARPVQAPRLAAAHQRSGAARAPRPRATTRRLSGLSPSSPVAVRSRVGLGRRAARRRALRAGASAWNRRAAAQATRPSARLPQNEQTARTGRKPGTQAARPGQAVATAPGTDGATQPPVALILHLTGLCRPDQSAAPRPNSSCDSNDRPHCSTRPAGTVGPRAAQHRSRRQAP
jgi:hypothetical protein